MGYERTVAGLHCVNVVPVGSKIWFRGEKQGYTVRASNVAFSICTKPFNPKHTVLYSVIDWEVNIRGTENLIFGMGAETDEDCQGMLDRLTAGETKVSRRNYVKLDIVKYKDARFDKIFEEEK